MATAAAVVAAKDAEIRRQEVMFTEIRKSLSERGAVFERKAHSSDDRPLRPMDVVPSLQRTGAYLEHRNGRQSERNRSSYLTEDPAITAAKKQSARHLAAIKAAGPTAAETAAVVHARTKALLSELQHDSLKHAMNLKHTYDSKQVFEPSANSTRALSTTRMTLRRTASMPAIKQKAHDQVAQGYVPRSEAAVAAAAVASGASVADLRAPDLIRGRLELLDERLAEGILVPAKPARSTLGGMGARGRLSREGASARLNLTASRGSATSTGSVSFAPGAAALSPAKLAAAPGMTRSASGPAGGGGAMASPAAARKLGAARSQPALPQGGGRG